VTQKDDGAWAEAQRRCRLSDEEVRMARELGFRPKSLIKNIPSPSQKWKAPVGDWVRSLYEEKIGARRQAAGAPSTPAVRNQVIELRNPAHPWPDKPEIPELVLEEPFDSDDYKDEDVDAAWDQYAFQNRIEEPSEEEIDQQNTRMLRQQCLYRWAAQCLVPGCGAQPFLQKFQRYRFNSARFEGEPKVTLFDRTGGFLVRPPRIDAEPARFVRSARKADEDFDDEDPPF
jgi:hypothetical protein